ncbi:MAG: methyltransferase domain-containing protein [Methylophaga sp.]|nr:methyltransferase domain-containing protein [Methylophaga sp.]
MTSSIDKSKVAKHFSASALRYQQVTPVQEMMANALLEKAYAHFTEKDSPKKILEIGCGTGRLTWPLSQIYPRAEITALDIAPAMVEITAAKCPRANVVLCDAETFLQSNTEYYDLVISNATIQWFARPVSALMNARSCLSQSGFLVVASFGGETFKELRKAFEHAYFSSDMQATEHVVEMIDVSVLQDLFPEANVDEQHVKSFHASPQEFLKSLRDAGVVNANTKINPLKKQIYKKMCEYYQKQFYLPEREAVFATYHTFTLAMSSSQ